MKKLIAIAVVFALVAGFAFAQDDTPKWKVGFKAQHFSDMLWYTTMSGKSEDNSTGTKITQEFGKFNKGTFNFFSQDESRRSGDWDGRGYIPTPSNWVLLSLTNTGEHHEIYADIRLNNWAKEFNGVFDFLSQGQADWWAKGDAGIFNGQIGTAGYGGFVSTHATWNDYLGWNQLCRFGVWRADNSFLASNEFRTWNEWGTIVALGATLADNYRISLGYRVDPDDLAIKPSNPAASISNINASFMVSGKVTDEIAFDLFYAVKGGDPDTFERKLTTTTPPDGKWDNILGAYIGLGIVENLGLSLGYTANFVAYETGGYLAAANTDPTTSKPRTFVAPVYSGVDLRVNYSGIDNIGVTFNNNLSFAGVTATKIENQEYDKVNLRLDNKTPYFVTGDASAKKDWFHWNSELQAKLALIENLNLIVHLGNQLGVVSYEGSESGSSYNCQYQLLQFQPLHSLR